MSNWPLDSSFRAAPIWPATMKQSTTAMMSSATPRYASAPDTPRRLNARRILGELVMILPPDLAILPRSRPYATIEKAHAISVERERKNARPNGRVNAWRTEDTLERSGSVPAPRSRRPAR